MALNFIKQLDIDHILGCWKIEESLPQLEKGIHPKDLDFYQKQYQWSERRKMEWLAVRQLLIVLLPNPPQIKYDSDGKPYLESSPYQISISHSALLAVVVLAKSKSVGVDIQEIRRSVIAGRNYFCNTAEQKWLSANDVIAHNLLWSAKETLFKYYGKANMNTKEEIEICPFSLEHFGQLSAYIYDSGHRYVMKIHYLQLSTHVLTYTS